MECTATEQEIPTPTNSHVSRRWASCKHLVSDYIQRLQISIIFTSKNGLTSEHSPKNLQDISANQTNTHTYLVYAKDNSKLSIEMKRKTKRLIDVAIVLRLTGACELLGADDEGKLRDIARHMVDSRLTDRKKQILVLIQGLNQTQISERLTELEGKNVSPQAVSKIMKSMPTKIFQLYKVNHLTS